MSTSASEWKPCASYHFCEFRCCLVEMNVVQSSIERRINEGHSTQAAANDGNTLVRKSHAVCASRCVFNDGRDFCERRTFEKGFNFFGFEAKCAMMSSRLCSTTHCFRRPLCARRESRATGMTRGEVRGSGHVRGLEIFLIALSGLLKARAAHARVQTASGDVQPASRDVNWRAC